MLDTARVKNLGINENPAQFLEFGNIWPSHVTLNEKLSVKIHISFKGHHSTLSLWPVLADLIVCGQHHRPVFNYSRIKYTNNCRWPCDLNECWELANGTNWICHIAFAGHNCDGQIMPKFNDSFCYRWSSDAFVYNIYGENVRKNRSCRVFDIMVWPWKWRYRLKITLRCRTIDHRVIQASLSWDIQHWKPATDLRGRWMGVMITACATPWPLNRNCGVTRGHRNFFLHQSLSFVANFNLRCNKPIFVWKIR